MCTAGWQWRELYWIVVGAVYAGRPVPGCVGAVRSGTCREHPHGRA